MFKTFPIVLDVTKHQLNDMFQVNNNDLNTIRLNLSIKSGLEIFDLTGKVVRIAIKKPDGFIAFQTGGVIDPANGLCEFILDRQAYLVEGKHEAEVMIYQDDSTVIVTERFYYKVNRAIANDKTLISTNHLPALSQAIIAGEQLQGIDIPEFVEAANGALETIENAEIQGDYAKDQGDYAKEKGDLAAQRVTELNGVDAVQFKDRQDGFDVQLTDTVADLNGKTNANAVVDFGAKGDYNGTTGMDNSPKIQSAIDTSATNTIDLPEGNFLCLSPIKLKNKTRLVGKSRGKTILTFKDCSGLTFNDLTGSTYYEDILLENITVKFVGANKTGFIGIDFSFVSHSDIRSCKVDNFDINIKVNGYNGTVNINNYYNSIWRSDIRNGNTGILLDRNSNENTIQKCFILNNVNGIHLKGNDRNEILQNSFEGNGGKAIFIEGSSDVTKYCEYHNILSNRFEANFEAINISNLGQYNYFAFNAYMGNTTDFTNNGNNNRRNENRASGFEIELNLAFDALAGYFKNKGFLSGAVVKAEHKGGSGNGTVFQADTDRFSDKTFEGLYNGASVFEVTSQGVVKLGTGKTGIYFGSANPEASITANVGSIYLCTSDASATNLFVKEDGTGNTGWKQVNLSETERYMKSPDGSRYKITVGNDGALTTTKL